MTLLGVIQWDVRTLGISHRQSYASIRKGLLGLDHCPSYTTVRKGSLGLDYHTGDATAGKVPLGLDHYPGDATTSKSQLELHHWSGDTAIREGQLWLDQCPSDAAVRRKPAHGTKRMRLPKGNSQQSCTPVPNSSRLQSVMERLYGLPTLPSEEKEPMLTPNARFTLVHLEGFRLRYPLNNDVTTVPVSTVVVGTRVRRSRRRTPLEWVP